MDRGGCRMSSGGGGDGPDFGPQHGMITLEDLESFSEDQLSDSGNVSLEGEGETMDDDDQLLRYWQDAARGHQVDVPTDMAEPIHQLTSNNDGHHSREKVPFTLLTRNDKCGDVLWEKRHYEKAHWACITIQEDTYEQSICYGFMKIMRYICQQNTSGNYLGMTIPIVTVVRTSQDQSTLFREVTVAYYLPPEHQAQPPQALDTDVVIQEWPAIIAYTREFGGATNEVTIINEIRTMAELLGLPETCVSDSFVVAGYTNPAAAVRHNEIWFLERP